MSRTAGAICGLGVVAIVLAVLIHWGFLLIVPLSGVALYCVIAAITEED